MAITLAPDVERALREQARRQGMTPERLVLDLLRERLATHSTATPQGEWESLLLSAGSPAGVSLTDEQTSSEFLYD